jgi:hypothetical protein
LTERAVRLLPIALVAIAMVAVVVLLLTRHTRPPRLVAAATSTTLPATSTPVSSTSTTTSSTTTSSTTTTTTTTTSTTTPPPPTVPVSDVLVEVVNGSGASGLAATTATALHAAGFAINGTMDAESFIYSTSVIEYPPGDLSDAYTVLAHLNGPTRLVEDSSVPTGEVHFIVGSTFQGVAQ